MLVSRVIVAQIIEHLDPIYVNMRRRGTLSRQLDYNQDLNWVWTLGEYDKLKLYGFEIHRWIDGYSTRILWLSVYDQTKSKESMESLLQLSLNCKSSSTKNCSCKVQKIKILQVLEDFWGEIGQVIYLGIRAFSFEKQ